LPGLESVALACCNAALMLYLAAGVVAVARPAWGRWPLIAGALAQAAGMVARGVAIGYFPLTNKFESFSAASLAVALVAAATWRPVRAYSIPLVAVAAAALAAALRFPADLAFPPPLMRTVWYPLHIPLSFGAYGLWTAAAAASIAWLADREGEAGRRWLAAIDRFALLGFGAWSLGMICGGVWGVLAWGAYFLWDPKVVWSVVLWFHYASLTHVRYAPSLRARDSIRPALALAGFAFVFVAYVGTSFFFGRSSHAF